MIRFLLFGIVLYYLFKFLSKIFGGFIIKKAAQQFGAQNQYSSTNQRNKKEGEIFIKTKPKDNKKHVQGGDYVDFEEVN